MTRRSAHASSSRTSCDSTARRTVTPTLRLPAASGTLAGDRAQQRRLAGAVDPDDAGALARRQAPGDVVEQHPVADSDARVEQVDDVLAEPGRREPHELDVVARGRLVGDEGVRRVDAELGLARAGGRAAPQPGELLAQEVVAPLGGDPGHPLALGLGEHEGRVATLVGECTDARVDLPRLGRDGVEEPPVVGDGDDGVVGPGVPLDEVVGEPGDALDVEVVGRLVEQEEVGRGDEQGGQRDPAALATRERADRGAPSRPRRGRRCRRAAR